MSTDNGEQVEDRFEGGSREAELLLAYFPVIGAACVARGLFPISCMTKQEASTKLAQLTAEEQSVSLLGTLWGFREDVTAAEPFLAHLIRNVRNYTEFVQIITSKTDHPPVYLSLLQVLLNHDTDSYHFSEEEYKSLWLMIPEIEQGTNAPEILTQLSIGGGISVLKSILQLRTDIRDIHRIVHTLPIDNVDTVPTALPIDNSPLFLCTALLVILLIVIIYGLSRMHVKK